MLSLVNSGSSANLLELATLTDAEFGDRQRKPGDEGITTAASFPTTVNPISSEPTRAGVPGRGHSDLQHGTRLLEQAVTPRTSPIMVAHTLGNPFDLDLVVAVARKFNHWVIEGTCNALGAEYRGQRVGTFTQSDDSMWLAAQTPRQALAALTDVPQRTDRRVCTLFNAATMRPKPTLPVQT